MRRHRQIAMDKLKRKGPHTGDPVAMFRIENPTLSLMRGRQCHE
jgi:hypothetical protein